MFALKLTKTSTTVTPTSRKRFYIGKTAGQQVFGLKTEAKTWKTEVQAVKASDSLYDFGFDTEVVEL